MRIVKLGPGVNVINSVSVVMVTREVNAASQSSLWTSVSSRDEYTILTLHGGGATGQLCVCQESLQVRVGKGVPGPWQKEGLGVTHWTNRVLGQPVDHRGEHEW